MTLVNKLVSFFSSDIFYSSNYSELNLHLKRADLVDNDSFSCKCSSSGNTSYESCIHNASIMCYMAFVTLPKPVQTFLSNNNNLNNTL